MSGNSCANFSWAIYLALAAVLLSQEPTKPVPATSPELAQPADQKKLDRLAAEYRSAAERGLTPALQPRYPRYRLRKGDVFTVTLPHLPSFNQTLTVQPDGFVTFNMIGDLHVENMTVPELTAALVSAYSRTLRDPVVTVELKEFEKPYFLAAGEIGRPGKYELRGNMSVAQAVAIAGGLTDYAKHSEVILFRATSDDWVEARQVNLKQLLQKKDLSEDLQVQPGDLLFVPKNALGRLRLIAPRLILGPSIRPF